MTIYVATVSDDRPASDGRLVMLRRVLPGGKWELMWSDTVKTDLELVRAWDIVGEKIIDDTVKESGGG